MRFWKALLGLIVLAGFGYAAYSMRTNDGKLPWETARTGPRDVTLPARTQIQLILLEGLDAGGSKEGDKVSLGVLEPVKVGGEVLIPLGTKAIGTVVESRGASLLNAVINRPARLAIRLEAVELDGQRIPIVTQEGDALFQFTQENTAERIESAKIDRLWNDPEARNALIAIAESSVTGKNLDERQKELRQLAERLGMDKTTDIVQGNNVGIDLSSAITMLRSGNASSLTGVEAVLAAQAAGEIADLVSSVDHKVRGVFKGRTIRATIGTPIVVYTARRETITLSSGSD